MAVAAQLACVGFTSEADAALSGHPPVVLGDILDDLPVVDNFELHERQRYRCEPQRVTQAWLRREPEEWMATRQERLAAHEAYMLEEHVSVVPAAMYCLVLLHCCGRRGITAAVPRAAPPMQSLLHRRTPLCDTCRTSSRRRRWTWPRSMA